MTKPAPMSFRLDPELKEKLRALADADKRSLTNYIEVVLERHVAWKEPLKPDENWLPTEEWDARQLERAASELRKPKDYKG